MTPCTWCGLRVALTTVAASPTCSSCAGSRTERIRSYLQRLKRAAEGKAA